MNASTIDLSRFLKRGDNVVWTHACGEPQTLVEALIEQAPDIGDISAFAATSFSGLLDERAAHAFHLSSMGAMGPLRQLASAGKLGIIPCHLSQIGPMIVDGTIGCDVAFVHVAPPNANGNHSLGPTSDYVAEMVAKARVVIAEINDQMPVTSGATVPASRIDYGIETSRLLVEVPPHPPTAHDEAIAQNIAEYVGDGAVIQAGIGAVPDAVLRRLGDRRDLGVHSGMLSDGFVDLVEKGVITNARKEIDSGISIATLLIGSKRLFDHAHNNPALHMCSSDYAQDPAILAQLSRLVTINSAMEVDLTGQVNAEQSGATYLGGTGGQVDFVRAGARSPGGHSIIALPSTAKGGKVSRIVASLSGPVTTARSEVDIIITEYGAAELRGQTLPERAKRMVQIVHPDFREELEIAAHTLGKRGF